MKRKLLRWTGIAAVVLVLVFVGFILSIDTIAKFVAQKRIESQTGFPARIGAFHIGLKSPVLEIRNLTLKNPDDFGGGTFLEMPELYLEYDREALGNGKLHLKVCRIDVQKIQICENRDGRKNIDRLKNASSISELEKPISKQHGEASITFDGIDLLDVTLGSVEFTSEQDATRNFHERLGIVHEKFHNLKTELDFQTAEAVLVLKAGMSGALNFDTLWKPKTKKLRKPDAPVQNEFHSTDSTSSTQPTNSANQQP